MNGPTRMHDMPKKKGRTVYLNTRHTKVVYSSKVVQLARATVKINQAERLAVQAKPKSMHKRSKLAKLRAMKTAAAAKFDEVPQESITMAAIGVFF